MNNFYTNWKSYYDKNQYDNYKLHDSEFVQTFFTNNADLNNEHNLFYLNSYLGELPMFYYIWKNNLKSKFITISQYRRDLSNIDFNYIDKTNKIQAFCTWQTNESVTSYDLLMNHNMWESYIVDNWYDSIKDVFNMTDKEIDDIKCSINFINFAVFVFSCKWEQFCKLCEIIFGFLDKCFPNNSWQDIETLENFRKKQLEVFIDKYGEFDYWNYLVDKRYIVFFVEAACRCTIDKVFGIFSLNKDCLPIVCDLHGEDYCFVDLASFIQANVKTGAKISLINGGESLEKNIKHLVNYCNHAPLDITINETFDDCIQIEFDEYIETDSALHYFNKKYEIKKRW